MAAVWAKSVNAPAGRPPAAQRSARGKRPVCSRQHCGHPEPEYDDTMRRLVCLIGYFTLWTSSLTLGGTVAASAVVNPADFVHVCKPINTAARGVGSVVFKLSGDGRRMTIVAPTQWQSSVAATPALPPQDPPSLRFLLNAGPGKNLPGLIIWRDDSTTMPSYFAIQLGMRGREILWARWSCV